MIGLSGAGKTTLANEVIRLANQNVSNVALVDGDMIRDLFGNDLGFTLEDRRKNAERMMRLCQWLDAQGIHVVCAILSLFPEHRKWMRDNEAEYFEVYIEAALDQVQARDVKGLYAKYASGEISEVAGLDLPFPVPSDPDLIIVNDGDENDLLAHARPLAQKIIAA